MLSTRLPWHDIVSTGGTGSATRPRGSLVPLRAAAMGQACVTQRLDPDALVVFTRVPHGISKPSRRPGSNLDPRLALHHLDASHFLPRHVAPMAQERQQPARISIAVASDIETEPDPFVSTVAVAPPWTRARRLTRLCLRLGLQDFQLLRSRQGGTEGTHQSRRHRRRILGFQD